MGTRVEVYTHGCPHVCTLTESPCGMCHVCGHDAQLSPLCAGPVCHMTWLDQGHYPHFAGGETEARKGLFVGLDLNSRFQPLSPLSGNM